MSRLELLRDHLSAPPSAGVWEHIIALFDPWSASEDLQVGLDYANQHLDQSWPDTLRVAPQLWLDVLFGGPKNARSERQWGRTEREHPALRLARTLDFGGRVLAEAHFFSVRKVAFFADITRLVGHKVDGSAVAHLARRDGARRPFHHLRHLELRDSVQLGSAGMRGLARFDLSLLDHLDLGGCNVDGASLAELLGAADLSALRWLALDRNPIGAHGAEALAATPMPALEHLDVNDAQLGVDGAGQLGGLQSPALRSLRVALNDLGAEGVGALERAGLPALRSLDVAGNGLGPDGVRALSALPLAQLTTLEAGYNGLGPDGLRALSTLPLDGLERLDLTDNALGDEGAAAFDFAALGGLSHTRLAWNGMSQAATAALQSRVPATVTLDLRWNHHL